MTTKTVKRTTHGHLTTWFVPQQPKAKRRPFAPLNAAIVKKQSRFNVMRGRPWRGRTARPAWWVKNRPLRPRSRRYSDRAPSLRLLTTPSLSVLLDTYGSNLNKGEAFVGDVPAWLDGNDFLADVNGPYAWLDPYGTNDYLFNEHSTGAPLQPAAVEGYGLDSPFSEANSRAPTPLLER